MTIDEVTKAHDLLGKLRAAQKFQVAVERLISNEQPLKAYITLRKNEPDEPRQEVSLDIALRDSLEIIKGMTVELRALGIKA